MDEMVMDIRLNSMEENAERMRQQASMAIGFLKHNPNPDKAIMMFTAWNQSQSDFWYSILKLAIEMREEINETRQQDG